MKYTIQNLYLQVGPSFDYKNFHKTISDNTYMHDNLFEFNYRKRLNSGPGPLVMVRLESMRHSLPLTIFPIYFIFQ